MPRRLAPVSLFSSVCSPGSHEILKRSKVKWEAAKLIGYMPAGLVLYEQRLCPHCGSCLARPIQILKLRYLRDAQPARAKCAA